MHGGNVPVILNGFELFVGVEPIRYPDRYYCSDAESMWNLVMRLLAEVEAEAGNPSDLEPSSFAL